MLPPPKKERKGDFLSARNGTIFNMINNAHVTHPSFHVNFFIFDMCGEYYLELQLMYSTANLAYETPIRLIEPCRRSETLTIKNYK